MNLGLQLVLGGLRKRPFVPGVDGEGMVLPIPPNFTGYEYLNLTGVVVNNFTIVPTPNRVPKHFTCRVQTGDISIAGGRTLTSNEIDIFNDLELQFVITKANGDPVPNYFGYLEPVTEDEYNIYSDTKEGNYFGIIPVHEEDGYLVTLYARGKNGANIRVGSLTKSFETAPNELSTFYADADLGNIAYDGLSPYRITSTATYTDSTKRLVGTGIAADYDHAAATANICPIYHYNDFYLTGANEGGFPVGRRKVAAKISDDEVELEQPLGADYTGITFSTGPRAVPGTLSNRNWYVSGAWPSLQLEASRYTQYIYGYKDGFTLTSSDNSGYVIQAGIVSASLEPPADHQFFMGNGTVDGEFLNRPYGRSLSSTKTGVIRHLLHNVKFARPNSQINFEFNSIAAPDKYTCHHAVIGCEFDNRLKDSLNLISEGNPTGTTSFLVRAEVNEDNPTGTIPPEYPTTGFIWFLDNNGRLLYGTGSKNRIAYTSWAETETEGVYAFELASATGRDCNEGNPALSSDSGTRMYNAFVFVNNEDSTAGFVNNKFKTHVADDEKDHDLYISGYLSGTAVLRNDFGDGFASSYGVNANMKSGIDDYIHNNIVFANNKLSKHRRFGFDMSNTNANNPLEYAKGVLMRDNHSNVLHCFCYHYSGQSMRVSRNTHENTLNLGSQSSLWAMVVRSKWTSESPPDSGYRLVMDNNLCINSRLLKYDQNEPALEVVNNDNQLDFDAQCIQISSTAYAGGVFSRNNLYNPAQSSGHVALIDGSGKTLEEFNNQAGGLNTSENSAGTAELILGEGSKYITLSGFGQSSTNDKVSGIADFDLSYKFKALDSFAFLTILGPSSGTDICRTTSPTAIRWRDLSGIFDFTVPEMVLGQEYEHIWRRRSGVLSLEHNAVLNATTGNSNATLKWDYVGRNGGTISTNRIVVKDLLLNNMQTDWTIGFNIDGGELPIEPETNVIVAADISIGTTDSHSAIYHAIDAEDWV